MKKYRKNNKEVYIRVFTVLLMLVSLTAAGCARKQENTAPSVKAEKIPGYEPFFPGVNDSAGILDSSADSTYTFLTTNGTSYTADLNKAALGNDYDKSAFWRDADNMLYKAEGYEAVQGIDVSEHNGTINWRSVKDAGVSFAVLRAGYRGYTEGKIQTDASFTENLINARKNDIKVGAYFFSQAVNEEEAREEAEYVLDIVKNYGLELPIFYDPEDIPDENARTKGLSGEQLTANAAAFCDVIEEAGYQAGLYCNEMWQAYTLDMSGFNDVQIWLVDYRDRPQSPYHFEYWQYTCRGTVPGIPDSVDVDMDIRLIPAAEEEE